VECWAGRCGNPHKKSPVLARAESKRSRPPPNSPGKKSATSRLASDQDPPALRLTGAAGHQAGWGLTVKQWGGGGGGGACLADEGSGGGWFTAVQQGHATVARSGALVKRISTPRHPPPSIKERLGETSAKKDLGSSGRMRPAGVQKKKTGGEEAVARGWGGGGRDEKQERAGGKEKGGGKASK